MPADLIAGFLSGTVLIVAIGAQNSYVLRQGIRGEHILPLVLLCASADALLIEVHPNPTAAWSDGPQQLSLDLFARLMEELRPFIAAAGRE